MAPPSCKDDSAVPPVKKSVLSNAEFLHLRFAIPQGCAGGYARVFGQLTKHLNTLYINVHFCDVNTSAY